jgi:hypothetical protein
MPHYIPWILASGSLLLLLAAAVSWLLRQRRGAAQDLPAAWELSARPVFSHAERRLYRLLREALPQQVILAKLPLVRFCQPNDPKSVRYWFNLLGTSHVSFAICSNNGRVLAAIDLLGDQLPSRRAATIKQSVLAACRINHLSCTGDRMPSVAELLLLVPSPNAAAAKVPTVPDATAAQRSRKALWLDSGYMQDSFFGIDGRADFGASAGFRSSKPGSLREIPPLPDDIGGVVIDTPVSPLRH